jgi:hypothetical protein
MQETGFPRAGGHDGSCYRGPAGPADQPRLRRIAAEPDGFTLSRDWTSRAESDVGCGGGWLVSHGRVLAVSLVAGTLSTARDRHADGCYGGPSWLMPLIPLMSGWAPASPRLPR